MPRENQLPRILNIRPPDRRRIANRKNVSSSQLLPAYLSFLFFLFPRAQTELYQACQAQKYYGLINVVRYHIYICIHVYVYIVITLHGSNLLYVRVNVTVCTPQTSDDTLSEIQMYEQH